MTPGEFITARLDELAAAANATAPSGTRLAWKASHESDGGPVIHWVTSDLNPAAVAQAYGLERGTGHAVAEHIALHDPVFVLAWVAAMRATLARYSEPLAGLNLGDQLTLSQERMGLLYAIEQLASIWSGHPDYRPEWKVATRW